MSFPCFGCKRRDVETTDDPRYENWPTCEVCKTVPVDLPCQQYTHCERRGPHGGDHRYNHDLPGGAFFRDPRTGRSPLDDAIAAEARKG